MLLSKIFVLYEYMMLWYAIETSATLWLVGGGHARQNGFFTERRNDEKPGKRKSLFSRIIVSCVCQFKKIVVRKGSGYVKSRLVSAWLVSNRGRRVDSTAASRVLLYFAIEDYLHDVTPTSSRENPRIQSWCQIVKY